MLMWQGFAGSLTKCFLTVKHSNFMFFSPLLYRLSYQATKSANYTQLCEWAWEMSLTVLALRECWQILCGVGVLYPADGGA